MQVQALTLGLLPIDFTQLLTGVLVGVVVAYFTALIGQYIQDRRRPLISWSVLFDGPVDLSAPGMWDITWDGQPVNDASLVILEIADSGSSILDAGSWEVPLTFSFPGRRVIHFKVRDSVIFEQLIKTPPYAKDAQEDTKAKIIGEEKVQLPKIRIKRRDRFKLHVLLTGTGTGVTPGGRLTPGEIKEHSRRKRRRLRFQRTAIGIGAALGLAITLWLVTGGSNEEKPNCAGGVLTLEGSTAFAPIAADVVNDYESQCTAASSEVSAIGSKEGVDALKHNPIPDAIAMSDGPYPGDTSGLTVYRVGIVFFAVVANRDSVPSSLSPSQLRDIFTYYPSGNYIAVGRVRGSGTRAALEENVLGPERKAFPANSPCPTPSQKPAPIWIACTMNTTMDLLSYINQTPHAIGYAEADALAFFPNVSVVAINGALPTRDAVLKGLYPFVATEYLYTVKDPSALTKDYIEFLTSHTVTVQLRDRDFIGCSDLPGGVCPP
jgi:ABC-type phosphate transport system substrate-binding protein